MGKRFFKQIFATNLGMIALISGCYPRAAKLNDKIINNDLKVEYRINGFTVTSKETNVVYKYYSNLNQCSLEFDNRVYVDNKCDDILDLAIVDNMYIYRNGNVYCKKHDHWLKNVPEFVKAIFEKAESDYKLLKTGLRTDKASGNWKKKFSE